MIGEAEAYSSFDSIEKLVQEGDDLHYLPVQPLYVVLKTLSEANVGEVLPKFNLEQRTAFLDLDLWHKDQVDVESFEFWLRAYSFCKDDKILYQFAKSEEFSMYLKARFDISTFDVEDPSYPDNDNFFLTDDNLLLVEFDEDYNHVEEMQKFIRILYAEDGVENSYAHLFKIVSDSFLIYQEDEYQLKKSRLADLGMVDYFDALEMDNIFPNKEVMDNFIFKKKTQTANIDDEGKKQTLHLAALVAFKDKSMNAIQEELSKINDSKRFDYLNFNFMRLVNGTISLNNCLKDGSVAMTRIGNKTRNFLLLGFNYVRFFFGQKEDFLCEQGFFGRFDFIDFYKIGNTLIGDMRKKIKKALRDTPFENSDCFLGGYWSNYLDDSFNDIVKIQKGRSKAVPVVEMNDFWLWSKKGKTLLSLIPFVTNFYNSFMDLQKENRIQDSFYINYNVSDIDFESIILSSLANFMLGNYEGDKSGKMGISIDEYRKWATMIVDKNGEIIVTSKLIDLLNRFSVKFGLDHSFKFTSYLQELLTEHVGGYKHDQVTDEDFKHIGGPIIFFT